MQILLATGKWWENINSEWIDHVFWRLLSNIYNSQKRRGTYKKETVIVKSEQAKGLILESKMMMMMIMMMMIMMMMIMMMMMMMMVVVVVVVAVYHLLLLFHMRPAKHHTLTVVTVCLSDAHDVGSGFHRNGGTQSPIEIWWHTVTHGRGSEEETGEWSV